MADPREHFLPPLGETPTAADRDTIRIQLGMLRYEPVSILSRCAAGRPQVVLSYFGTTDRGGASASVYWMTCPHLRKHVDRLEAAGWIRQLEASLQEDTPDRDQLVKDQAIYEDEVRRLAAAVPGEWPPPRLDTGIGGVSDRRRLKCAHAHVSFHLAHPEAGVAGRLTLEKLERTIPRSELMLCPKRACPGEGTDQ